MFEIRPMGNWQRDSWLVTAITAAVLLSFQFYSTKRDHDHYAFRHGGVVHYGWPYASVTRWEPTSRQIMPGHAPPPPPGIRFENFAKLALPTDVLLETLAVLIVGLAIDLIVRRTGLAQRFPSWRCFRAITITAAGLVYCRRIRPLENLLLFSGFGLVMDVLICSLLTLSTGLLTETLLSRLQQRRQFRVADLLKLTTVGGLTFAFWRDAAILGCGCGLEMPSTVDARLMPYIDWPYWYFACAVYLTAVAATIWVGLGLTTRLLRGGYDLARADGVLLTHRRPATTASNL